MQGSAQKTGLKPSLSNNPQKGQPNQSEGTSQHPRNLTCPLRGATEALPEPGLGILRWTVPVFVEGAAEETFRIVIVLDERHIFSSFGDILPDLRVIDD